MKKSVTHKICIFTFIPSFFLYLYSQFLIFIYNYFFQGCVFERVIFFIFFFSTFLLLKSKQKFISNKHIVFSTPFIFATNYIRACYANLICTTNETDFNAKFVLKEIVAIESRSVFQIYKKLNFIERQVLDFSKISWTGKISWYISTR